MSFTRLTLFALSIFLQDSHGQQNSLNTGQTNLNPLFQSNIGGVQPCSDGLNQDGSAGNLASNLNSQTTINLQSLLSQSPSSLGTSFLLQPQSFSQPISLQLSNIPNLQQMSNLQQSTNIPQSQNSQANLQQLSNLQQSSPLQQSSNIAQTLNTADNLFLQQQLPQSDIVQQPQNSYIPINFQQVPYMQAFNTQQLSLGDFNTHQQPIVAPIVQQLSTQSSQSIPMQNAAYITTLPSAPAVSSCAYQRRDVNNLGSNYLQPAASVQYSYVDRPQVAASYSSLPRIAILSSPNMPSNVIMPYGNQAVEVVESPLRVSNDFLDEEDISCDQDNLMSMLLELIQKQNKSPKKVSPSGYSVNSYPTPYPNQGSKSSLKTLLPLIINLLKDRKEDCGCRANCPKCERRNKIKKEIEPQVHGGYSKKRDYSLKEETFTRNESKEVSPKIVRAQKKIRKIKNTIPDISDESYENETDDYEGVSEEDVD